MRTEDDLLCLYISPPVFWCHTTSIDRSCGADLNTHVQLYCYNPSSVSFNLCTGMYKNPQKSQDLNSMFSNYQLSNTVQNMNEHICRSELMVCLFFFFLKQCTGQEWEKMLNINWTTKRYDLSWVLDFLKHLYSICVRAQVQPNRHKMSLQQLN